MPLVIRREIGQSMLVGTGPDAVLITLIDNRYSHATVQVGVGPGATTAKIGSDALREVAPGIHLRRTGHLKRSSAQFSVMAPGLNVARTELFRRGHNMPTGESA